MEKKRFNWILIISSVVLTLINLVLVNILDGTHYIIIPLYAGPIGLFLGIFGLMNFTKKHMIFKLILSAILSVIGFHIILFIVMIGRILICSITSERSCFLG
jgi:hypothetical protein